MSLYIIKLSLSPLCYLFISLQSSDDNMDLSIKTSSVTCATDANGERSCTLSVIVKHNGEESILDLAGGKPMITNGFRPSVYIR